MVFVEQVARVESEIHSAVVERPGYARAGTLADELTALVLGYLSSRSDNPSSCPPGAAAPRT
jgi:hypothetical protein